MKRHVILLLSLLAAASNSCTKSSSLNAVSAGNGPACINVSAMLPQEWEASSTKGGNLSVGQGLLYVFDNDGQLTVPPEPIYGGLPFTISLFPGEYRIWAVFNFNETRGIDFKKALLDVKNVSQLKETSIPFVNQTRESQTVFLNIGGDDSSVKVSYDETKTVSLIGKPLTSRIRINRITNNLNSMNAGEMESYSLILDAIFLGGSIPSCQKFNTVQYPEWLLLPPPVSSKDADEMYCLFPNKTIPGESSFDFKGDNEIYLMPNPGCRDKTRLNLRFCVPEGFLKNNDEKGGVCTVGIDLPQTLPGVSYTITDIVISNAGGYLEVKSYSMECVASAFSESEEQYDEF